MFVLPVFLYYSKDWKFPANMPEPAMAGQM